MEYYICLEEDRICYVRGRFKRCAGSGLRRCLEIVEWEFVEPVPDVASALTRLAEKYGMEGKRVNLIAGRETVRKTVREMAPGRRGIMEQGTTWWLSWDQPQSRRPDLILPTDGGQANMSMSR